MPISLNELTLENIGSWPKHAKVMALLFVAFFILGGGYWAFLRYQLETLDAASMREITLKKEFEATQQKAVNLPLYRAQLTQIEKELGTMLRELPNQTEIPGLLEDISKTGVTSGLKFDLFDPLEEIEHDFYVELPIQMIVQGNYEELANFVSKVAALSRIVTLHDFMIMPIQSKRIPKEQTVATELLTMKVIAKIYRYRST